MKLVIKRAYSSFFSSATHHVEQWNREIEQYRESLKQQGEIIDIYFLKNSYGRPKYYVFVLKEG